MPRRLIAFMILAMLAVPTGCVSMEPMVLPSPESGRAPAPAPFPDAPDSPDMPNASGDTLAFMTFNVRYQNKRDGENGWPNRREPALSMLATYRPDVIGTQEGLRRQLDDILERFPHYREVGPRQTDRRVAILFDSRRLTVREFDTFWLSDSPDVTNSKSWGNETPRMCNWARFTDQQTGQSFYVYNTHLDHMSKPSRLASVELLARRIASRRHPGLPVVVTGDFNASEPSEEIRFMKGEIDRVWPSGPTPPPMTLVDTFRVLHPDEKQAGTFHSFRGSPGGPKIDYVFVEPDAEVVDARICREEIGGRYPSDHFPVLARVKLR